MFLMRLERSHCRIEQHEAKHDCERTGWNEPSERGAGQRANRRRNFEKDSDAYVGESLPDVRGGGSRRSRNDRDKRSANRVPEIHVKDNRHHGYDDETAAESGEGTEQSGAERTDSQEDCQ